MDLQQLKNDRDAVEILIRTQLKSFIEKHQLREIDVVITPEYFQKTEKQISSFDVKIKIKI